MNWAGGGGGGKEVEQWKMRRGKMSKESEIPIEKDVKCQALAGR